MESNSKLPKLLRYGAFVAELKTENHAWWTAQQILREEDFPKHRETGFEISFFDESTFSTPRWIQYRVFRDNRPCAMDWL